MTHTDPDADLLTRIDREARAVARAFGVAAPGDLADALLDRIRHSAGGRVHYLRNGPSAESRAARDTAIRAAFNGRNQADLAAQHGLSERRVRQILSSAG